MTDIREWRKHSKFAWEKGECNDLDYYRFNYVGGNQGDVGCYQYPGLVKAGWLDWNFYVIVATTSNGSGKLRCEIKVIDNEREKECEGSIVRKVFNIVQPNPQNPEEKLILGDNDILEPFTVDAAWQLLSDTIAFRDYVSFIKITRKDRKTVIKKTGKKIGRPKSTKTIKDMKQDLVRERHISAKAKGSRSKAFRKVRESAK